jgi:hypothetical protein
MILKPLELAYDRSSTGIMVRGAMVEWVTKALMRVSPQQTTAE